MGLDVNGVDSLGASPLMYAALKGEVDIISKLVHKGAKVDFQDAANGWTALMQVNANTNHSSWDIFLFQIIFLEIKVDKQYKISVLLL